MARVIAADLDGRVFIYEAETGELAWASGDTGGQLWAVAAHEGFFYAAPLGSIEKRDYDGNLVWTSEYINENIRTLSVRDGQLLIGGTASVLLCDTETGALTPILGWLKDQTSTYAFEWAMAWTSDGTGFFAYDDKSNKVFRFDLEGNVVWSTPLNTAAIAEGMAVANGLVMVQRRGGSFPNFTYTVVAFDETTGAETSSGVFPLSLTQALRSMSVKGDYLYLGDYFRATRVNLATNTVDFSVDEPFGDWPFEVDGTADGTMFVGTSISDGRTYRLDGSGAVVWQTDPDLTSSDVVAIVYLEEPPPPEPDYIIEPLDPPTTIDECLAEPSAETPEECPVEPVDPSIFYPWPMPTPSAGAFSNAFSSAFDVGVDSL